MDLTLGDLARIVGGEVVGDPRTPISGAAGITRASTGDITLLSNPRYTPLLRRSAAAAVVVWKGFNHHDIPMIRVCDPEASFALIAARFSGPAGHPDWGVHEAASISKTARIGPSARVGPFVTVMDGASIGERTVLYPGVYVGAGASIGEDCVLHAGVAVLDRVVVMDRVVIHPGSVLGADGFGYSSSCGRHVKIPHLGSVLVESDVEIGANVTIDRARYDFTVVGNGTKIDNLVHVAHNVRIGPNCLIVAQAGLAGSVSVGEGALLAGQSGVERHVAIGPGARVAGKAGVTRDVPGGATVGGFPAQDKFRWLREEAALRKLPEILSRLRDLSERVKALEEEPGDDSRER